MHFHAVSAHFGSPKPWNINLTSSQKLSTRYYDDNSTPPRNNAMHPRLKGKIPKMLEWRFTKADWIIWMDSSVKVKKNLDIPEEIIKTSKGKPLCLFRHTKFSSIQKEAFIINEGIKRGNQYFSKRYNGEPIQNQVESYLKDRTFKDDKLFQMTFFAYHRSMAPLMQEWFLQNCIWSIEDQISFPYVLHKFGCDYSYFEGNALENNIFTWDWHSRENGKQTSR